MANPVLIVTQHFKPEVIGSAPYCTDMAEWLAQQGRAVTVLTGPAHYPNLSDFQAFNASAPKRAVEDGVVIERLRNWIPRKRSAVLRIVSEFLFFLAGIWALLSGRVRRHDLVVSLSPSIFAVMLGVLATRRKGYHVAVVHDIQSGLAAGLSMVRSGFMLRLMRWCECITLNRTDAVFVLTSEMQNQLRQIGVEVPIEIMPIWVDTDRIQPRPLGTTKAATLLYSGNLGRKQGLEQVMALAEDLASLRPEVKLLLRGDGSERRDLALMAAERGLRNVRFADLLPRDQLSDGLAMGDIHLVPQKPSAADFAIPSKIYSIMAAGRPFIATAHPGSSLWRLRKETGAFICVPPNDRAALSDATFKLLDSPELRSEMGAKGRAFIEQAHSKQMLLAKFGGALELLERNGSLEPQRLRVLVLEPDKDGHPREWLLHLMHNLADQEQIEEIWFVVAPELRRLLMEDVPPSLRDRIRLVALSPEEQRFCTHRMLPVSGFARWWVMRHYLRLTGADVGCFLSLDHLSLPLAFGLGAAGRKLSGILFRPSVHYPSLGAYRPTAAERIRDLRKAVLYRLMLLNSALTVVLSLDPFFPDYAARRYLGGHKVHALPDPVHPSPVISSALTLPIPVPPDRIVFLLFGVLTARKGILHLMTALRQLSPEMAARAAVVIAGKVAPELGEQLAQQQADLARERPELWFHIEDRWLGSDEINALVNRCDVVLAPYQRFVGSSGVVLWAARAGKPLLTQDYGLVGRLVQDYRLGLAADVTQPAQLAVAIEQMVEKGPQHFIDATAARKFILDRTPEAFAAHVFGSLRTS